MANKKLNQILAIEKGIKTSAYTLVTDFHNRTAKDEFLNGFEKTYQPVSEDGQKFPPESKRLQLTSKDVFSQVTSKLTELFDVTATKDWANCSAKADVVVDGTTLLKGVPPTYLLFLEKQLQDLHAFVLKFAELSQDKEWTFDPNNNVYRTTPVQTVKTEKKQEHIVVVQPTKEHPAQTAVSSKDVTIGYWSTVHISGAISKARKLQLLNKIEKLQKATKEAREEANTSTVTEQQIGKMVLDYIFAD